jgi:hypothetical protein
MDVRHLISEPFAADRSSSIPVARMLYAQESILLFPELKSDSISNDFPAPVPPPQARQRFALR